MSNRILTYLLGIWYLALFQIYPIVHVHWHDGDGLETCFNAAEIMRYDHAKHPDLHAGENDCHHTHVNADFDHFFSKKNDERVPLSCLNIFVGNKAFFQNLQNVQPFWFSSTLFLTSSFHTSLSNKSPPLI